MAITKMSHGERQSMSAAAMRTYPNIVRDWKLKKQEAALLLGVPDATYCRWKKSPERRLWIDCAAGWSLVFMSSDSTWTVHRVTITHDFSPYRPALVTQLQGCALEILPHRSVRTSD